MTSNVVSFYFSFPTKSLLPSSANLSFNYTSFICGTSTDQDCVEKICLANNTFSNWTIGDVYCFYRENCPSKCGCYAKSGGCSGGTECRRGGPYSGAQCKGFNGYGSCGCTWGCNSTQTRTFRYKCFKPPTIAYYPGAISVAYSNGRAASNTHYVFMATYNTNSFDTPAKVSSLMNNYLSDYSSTLSENQVANNQVNLNRLFTYVCTANTINLLQEPCIQYCGLRTSAGQKPSSNCAANWNTFCSFNDNIANTYCMNWCEFDSNNNTNCRDIYPSYCSGNTNFTKTLCKDYYKTQYINNQISETVSTILETNCAMFSDANGNVIDASGKIVEGGLSGSSYPVNTCACFLPKKVYNKFYNDIVSTNPELKPYMDISNDPQCNYPDCANANAITPNKKTCPSVAITSCIINNTVGGDVTNSNFNVVNNCSTELSNTGSYTDKGTNVEQTMSPQEKEQVLQSESVVATIPPANYVAEYSSETPKRIDVSSSSTTTVSSNLGTIVFLVFGILVIIGLIIYAMRSNSSKNQKTKQVKNK